MASSSTRKRGSKQFWPRVRAQKPVAKVGSWNSANQPKEVSFLGFPGYKVGMTNISVIDNFSHTLTKGTEINLAATVLECPPIRILGFKLLAEDDYGNLQIAKEITAQVKDKHLTKRLDVAKKAPKVEKAEDLISFAKENGVDELRVKVITTPSATGIGKKSPEVLELALSGSIEEQINFILPKLGTEVKVSEVFKGGELVDSHGVTKGKGHQGAVKRFGVKLTSHKSEKTRRHAGNLGAWTPSRVGHTVPLPGQHGYHVRTEWNKWVLNVSDALDKINPKSGFRHYGNVKNEYLIVKGSLQGPAKRLVTLMRSARPNERYPKVAPEVVSINN